MDVDRAVQQVGERLRGLPFCAAAYPASGASAGGAAGDLVAAVFPHADVLRNDALARYVGSATADGDEAGSFVSVFTEDDIVIRCIAHFLRRADGPALQPADLTGWDMAYSAAPPGAALSVVLTAGSGSITRLSFVREAAADPAQDPDCVRRRVMCLTAADGAASRRSRPGAGFTLVEVLVAAAVTGVVLAASYGWLWSVAALARRTDDRVQATTLADAAVRGIEGDVHASVGVAPPPAGRDAALSLALVHHHPGMAPESLLIVWDAARRVVWRNASGTYIADHVGSFRSPVPSARRSGDPGCRDDRRRLDGRHGGLRRTGGERRLCCREPAARDLGGRVVTARRAASGGYAMLAALLIMALAGTFALVVVGAVCSLQVVEGADAAGRRASATEADALSAVARSLRWRPAETTGSAAADDPASKESWQAAWSPFPAAPGDVWPRVAVHVATTARRANRRDDLGTGPAQRAVGDGRDVRRGR